MSVTTVDCDNCLTKPYNKLLSPNATVVNQGQTIISVSHVIIVTFMVYQQGDAILMGIIVQDTVCFNQNTDCLNDGFQFLNVENQKNLAGEDGILGLSPIEDSYSTSFIEELKT